MMTCMSYRMGLGILIAFACLSAQDFRATITGYVTDPSNAPVPGAVVKTIRDGTNETRETRTNSEGLYTIPYLEPGAYTVEVSASGFQLLRRTGIELRVADKLNLSAALEVGTMSQAITVAGEQEIIDTSTASRGLVFDPIKVTEFPLNGRQSYMLMALTPGVMFTQRTFGNTGFSGTRGWDVNGSYTMNGGRTGTNQFLLNGAPISSDGTWNLAPNVEAIGEFKVMVNTYDSQYGRSGGGHVNTTIKSGTNGWHGSVFDYWRNTVLDANTTQNNLVGAGRGKRNMHQYGGVIGGPVRKDKDFVFFSFEGFQERVPFPTVTNTIPGELRDGGGFSFYNQRIFDPLTSRPCVNGVDAPSCLSGGLFIRSPFPNNTLPGSRLSPIGRNIAALYPLPNGITPTLNQNYFGTGNVGKYRYEQPMARYDKVITDKDRVYALFSWQDGSEFRNQNGFDPPARTGNMNSTRSTLITTLSYTRILSPAMVLDLRGSYNPFTQNFPDVSDPEFTFDKLGIKKIPPVATFPSRLAPRVTVSDYNDILGNQYVNETSRKQLNFSAGIAQTAGKHSLKYGLEWAMVLRGTYSSGRPTGQIDFTRFWTQQYSGRGQGNQDGNAVASLLLGLPNGGSIAFNDTFYRREPYIAGYIQDDWKITRKLTLNLGLRYDVQYPLIEIHDRINGEFDYGAKNPVSDAAVARWRQLQTEWNATNPRYPYPNAPDAIRGGLTFAGVNGQPRRGYDFDFSNIQPRAGFAYQFVSKMVARGGYGIFYRTATQGNTTTGFNQSTGYQRSLDGDRYPSAGLTGPYSLEDPWPNGVIPPTGSSQGLLTNVGRGVSFDQRNRPIPRTQQWSFGLERELGWGMVMEASYVGSVTSRDVLRSINGNTNGLAIGNPGNDIYLAGQRDPNSLNQPVPNPFFGILPAASDFGAAPTWNLFNLYRRFPAFNGVRNNNIANGKVWYHGLQIRFEKRAFGNRAAGSLTWVLSYTFAKQMEYALRNDFNFESERLINQLTDIDRPHQFSFSGVWDLPFGKGRKYPLSNGFANAVFGGWNYNWIYTYFAGPPTPHIDADFRCASYIVEDQSPTRWFNNDRACYTQRAPFTFREVGDRFAWIRDPSKPQINMAIAKRFDLTERFKLEARGEAFNATNTPILRGPNTGFTSPQFGILPIQQDNFPRNIQLGLRLRF